jgi:hypothetical protein
MAFIVLTMVANAAALGQTGPMKGVSCDRMVQAILAFAVIQATLSSFVLAFRCMALYQLRWTVVSVLTLMMCFQFAFAIPVITTIPWTPGYPKGASECLNALTISDDSHLWCAINYAWTAVVDVTVLLLSLHRLTHASAGHHGGPEYDNSIVQRTIGYWTRLNSARQHLGRDGKKSMAHFLVDQGVGSVLLTLLFNMPVMILEFIHLNSQAVFIIYNIGVVANSIISCHIISKFSGKIPWLRLTMSVIVALNEHSRRRENTSSTSGNGKYVNYSSSGTYSANHQQQKKRTFEDPRDSSQIELAQRQCVN